MIIFKNHTALNVARGVKAFLSLEAGLTRGGSPGAPRLGVSEYLDLVERWLLGQVCSGRELVSLKEPGGAFTMIGRKRLANLRSCVESVLADGVPGDLIETGVWRGGATILMRAILKARGDELRRVWVADSFAGLPPPDPGRYPEDEGDTLYTEDVLSVSLQEVRGNFERFGLLDGQVRFLKGWFRDTLPQAPIKKLAVARLDGDMYESTMDGLVNLYPKLSPGGYLIVDDYGNIEACRKAVHDYRAAHGIKEEIVPVDWTGAYWRRAG